MLVRHEEINFSLIPHEESKIGGNAKHNFDAFDFQLKMINKLLVFEDSHDRDLFRNFFSKSFVAAAVAAAAGALSKGPQEFR